MELNDLLNIIPQVMQLFVPGYIFISIIRFFHKKKQDEFNHYVIKSIIASYVMSLPIEYFLSDIMKNEVARSMITILLSVVVAFIYVKISFTKQYKKVMEFIGYTTGSERIWYDYFDNNRGTHIRFYTKYNHDNVMIEGDVKYYDALENDCDIVLENYRIIRNNAIIFQPIGKDGKKIEALLYVNSKDIHGLEATYGAEK